jgi:hypothetical protein
MPMGLVEHLKALRCECRGKFFGDGGFDLHGLCGLGAPPPSVNPGSSTRRNRICQVLKVGLPLSHNVRS